MKRLSRGQKLDIISKGYNECLENSLCGNYISIDNECYHWYPIIKERGYYLGVEGIGSIKYNFDFTFNENIESMVEFVGTVVNTDLSKVLDK